MKYYSNQVVENKSAVVSVMAKIFAGPRQVVYSYLKIKALLKVATLSKKERETVLNSKIVKESRWLRYFLKTNFFAHKNWSDVAVKGLLVAIQLNNCLEINLIYANHKDEKRFKYVFPAMIAAAV
jgi:hypothetical protein